MAMGKAALKNQHRTTRLCPCGRGSVYTDNRPGTKRVNGELRCEECFIDNFYDEIKKKKEDNDA